MAIIRINHTEEINERLRKEGKVKYYDSPEDFAAILKMNEAMEKVRRDFIYKSNMSEISASKIILNA